MKIHDGGNFYKLEKKQNFIDTKMTTSLTKWSEFGPQETSSGENIFRSVVESAFEEQAFNFMFNSHAVGRDS